MDVNAQVSLLFNVSLQVRHLKVVVDPVDDKVREPGVLTFALEQAAEQFQTVLAEMVAKDFERHQSLVVRERLRELHQTVVLHIVIGHVQVNQTLVHCDSLCNCFGAVVRAFVVSKMQ